MKVLSTSQLIENIQQKGINIDSRNKRLFRRYNYYQVINAYKNLFVDSVENIDDIRNNINQGIDLDRYIVAYNLSEGLSLNEMFLRVCKAICKKYDRQPMDTSDVENYVKEIKEIDYYHHIFSNRVRYSDFIRIYKFEHELRTILLRYVLIIEESLKCIFVSSLNDFKVPDTFLMNLNNYRNDSKSVNDSIDSIKLVLEKQKNKYSKPISRKKSQNINIPFWIIINELTMKETLKVLNNLKDEYYNEIYQECISQFTSFDIKNKSLSSSEKKKYIDKMRNILEIISNFRNLLAHNQPLYLFNVKDVGTNNIGTISYDYPRAQTQNTMNSDTMSMFASFFGSDRYNSRTQNVKIDLSWIIYTIYKIILTLDNNSTIFDEILGVYKKYSIIDTMDDYFVSDYALLEALLKEVDCFLSYDFDSKSVIKNIDETLKYKRLIMNKGLEIKKLQKNMKYYRKKLKVNKSKSKYNIFQFLNKYTDYTGIDKSFFDKLK